MTTETPKTPDVDPEPIIELIETINPWLLVAAFIVGAAIVVGVVAYLGRDKGDE